MRHEQEEALIKGFGMDFLRLRLLPLLASTLLVCGGAGAYSVGVVTAAQKTRLAHPKNPVEFHYICPMHEKVTSKKRGTCPKCKMKLIRKPILKESTADSN